MSNDRMTFAERTEQMLSAALQRQAAAERAGDLEGWDDARRKVGMLRLLLLLDAEYGRA